MGDTKQPVQSRADLLARLKVPESLVLNTRALQRGIDNYHIDVRLSEAFVLHAREVIELVVKRILSASRPFSGNEELEDFRASYNDMVTTSLHRIKTDLTPEMLDVLQFGVIKFLLKEVRAKVDERLMQTEEKIAQQQYAGSRNLLATQEQLAWLRKHYDEFLYRSNRAILQQIQREENGLRELRKQLAPDYHSEVINVMFNPMLCATSPTEVSMLAESYALWPGGGSGFAKVNLRMEETFQAQIPELKFTPLRSTERLESNQAEVYDTLHGLFSAQDILGPSEDQSDQINESFCWLENPGNIQALFDVALHEKALRHARDEVGIKAHWSLKGELKKIRQVCQELRKVMMTEGEFREALACHLLKEHWTPFDQQIMDFSQACTYVAGNDSKRIIARLDQSKENVTLLLKRLEDTTKQLNKAIREQGDEMFLRVVTDVCRYRLHLKYFRFAHRVLNRVKVITSPEDIQLSRAGGDLYELLGFDDHQSAQETRSQIIHHTIIKADVRGSTTVIEELIRHDLNPASYFSTRFFNPISERLATYGAVKVFIEGDAIILGIYEESNDPKQWYSVARACGMAKDILDIVNSKNAHSKQTSLPMLEIGIGICYSDEAPLFLFDDDKPIMISPAIGDADRMSGCSWKLRGVHKGQFNIDVLELDRADALYGEKGQEVMRYNVNGIMLATAGFKKLMSEVPLKKLKLKVGERTETMFLGKFPDVGGKERDLIVREGVVGGWLNGDVVPNPDGQKFYEVLPNSKLASQVLEFARKSRAKEG